MAKFIKKLIKNLLETEDSAYQKAASKIADQTVTPGDWDNEIEKIREKKLEETKKSIDLADEIIEKLKYHEEDNPESRIKAFDELCTKWSYTEFYLVLTYYMVIWGYSEDVYDIRYFIRLLIINHFILPINHPDYLVIDLPIDDYYNKNSKFYMADLLECESVVETMDIFFDYIRVEKTKERMEKFGKWIDVLYPLLGKNEDTLSANGITKLGMKGVKFYDKEYIKPCVAAINDFNYYFQYPIDDDVRDERQEYIYNRYIADDSLINLSENGKLDFVNDELLKKVARSAILNIPTPREAGDTIPFNILVDKLADKAGIFNSQFPSILVEKITQKLFDIFNKDPKVSHDYLNRVAREEVMRYTNHDVGNIKFIIEANASGVTFALQYVNPSKATKEDEEVIEIMKKRLWH